MGYAMNWKQIYSSSNQDERDDAILLLLESKENKKKVNPAGVHWWSGQVRSGQVRSGQVRSGQAFIVGTKTTLVFVILFSMLFFELLQTTVYQTPHAHKTTVQNIEQ